jgi:hypothetical protein
MTTMTELAKVMADQISAIKGMTVSRNDDFLFVRV